MYGPYFVKASETSQKTNKQTKKKYDADKVKVTLKFCKDSVLWSNFRFLFVYSHNANNGTEQESFKRFLAKHSKIL